MREFRRRANFTQEQEDLDGVERSEKELMYIAEMRDPDDLKSADRQEEQEQWTVFTPSGTIRVRKIGYDKYVMTSKIKTDDSRIVKEVEQVVTEDMFNHYKEHADSGMRKTRYYFRTVYPQVFWEIDVFKDKNGEYILPWVKVDLELPVVIRDAPKLPFEFKKMIAPAAKLTSPEDRDFANDLLHNKFTIKKEKMIDVPVKPTPEETAGDTTPSPNSTLDPDEDAVKPVDLGDTDGEPIESEPESNADDDNPEEGEPAPESEQTT